MAGLFNDLLCQRFLLFKIWLLRHHTPFRSLISGYPSQAYRLRTGTVVSVVFVISSLFTLELTVFGVQSFVSYLSQLRQSPSAVQLWYPLSCTSHHIVTRRTWIEVHIVCHQCIRM